MENLPNEIWCNVFSYLDEKSVKSVNLTCKSWFELIRNDPNFSRSVCLTDHSLKEFLTRIEKSEWIWKNWPVMKTLELRSVTFDKKPKSPKEAMDLRKQINFKECSSLDKVVFPVHFDLADFTEDSSLSCHRHVGKVYKMSFNPKVEKHTFGIENIHYMSIELSGIAFEDFTVENFCDTLKFIGKKSKNIEDLKVDSKWFRHEALEEEKIENAFQNLLKMLSNSLKSVTVPSGGHMMIPQHFLRPLSENCSNMNSLTLFSEHAHLFIERSSVCYKTFQEFLVPNFICITCLSHDCKIIIDMLLEKELLGHELEEEVKRFTFISHQFKKNKHLNMILELWSDEEQNDSLYEWQKSINEKFKDIAKVEIVLKDAEVIVGI